MDPISLIILVALIGGASIFLDRKWQDHQAKQITAASDVADPDAPDAEAQPQPRSFFARTSDQAQALSSQAVDRAKALGVQAGSQTKVFREQASSQTKVLREQAVIQANSLRERIPLTPKKSTLPEEFRGWVMGATADEPALRTWLVGLGEEQFADFTGHVAAFCTSVGFELAWLVNGEFDEMPQLVANAEQVAVNYCRSCSHAAAAQTEINVFRRYRTYAQNPESRKERVYGERLLDHLLDLGLTTVSISEFLGVSAKDKQERVWQAIQAAAEKDAVAFNRALLAVSIEDAQPAAQDDPMPAAAAA